MTSRNDRRIRAKWLPSLLLAVLALALWPGSSRADNVELSKSAISFYGTTQGDAKSKKKVANAANIEGEHGSSTLTTGSLKAAVSDGVAMFTIHLEIDAGEDETVADFSWEICNDATGHEVASGDFGNDPVNQESVDVSLTAVQLKGAELLRVKLVPEFETDTDFSGCYFLVEICSCDCSCAAGCATADLGSIKFAINVGSGDGTHGGSGAYISYSDPSGVSNLGAANLRIEHGAGFTVTEDANDVLRIIEGEWKATVEDVFGFGTNGFRIKLENGSGKVFRVWEFEESTYDDAGGAYDGIDALEIRQKSYYSSTYPTVDTDGTKKFIYAHRPATATAKEVWILETGNGLRRIVRETFSKTASSILYRHKVQEKHGGWVTVSDELQTYTLYAWGRELTKTEVDPGGADLETIWSYLQSGVGAGQLFWGSHHDGTNSIIPTPRMFTGCTCPSLEPPMGSSRGRSGTARPTPRPCRFGGTGRVPIPSPNLPGNMTRWRGPSPPPATRTRRTRWSPSRPTTPTAG